MPWKICLKHKVTVDLNFNGITRHTFQYNLAIEHECSDAAKNIASWLKKGAKYSVTTTTDSIKFK